MKLTNKDLMIPVAEYVSVKNEDTLYDCFRALEDDKINKKKSGHAHRDALVFDANGDVAGKVTMTDIFMALEPAYKSILQNDSSDAVLTGEYLAKIYKDYDLWAQPMQDLCQKASTLKVENILHIPDDAEYIDADAPVDSALHKCVMGVHQPLLVRENGKVIGLLRFGDLFSQIKNLILACQI